MSRGPVAEVVGDLGHNILGLTSRAGHGERVLRRPLRAASQGEQAAAQRVEQIVARGVDGLAAFAYIVGRVLGDFD